MTTLDPHDFNQPSNDIPVEVLIGIAGGAISGGVMGFAARGGGGAVGSVVGATTGSVVWLEA